ncbi:MAG: lipase [Mesorhizobium amorphae]|nr:MAG: lipase [Mesorhizobium amorphae]
MLTSLLVTRRGHAREALTSARPALFAMALALAPFLCGSSPAQADKQNWVGTWMASPQPVWGPDFAFPTKIPQSVKNQTIRQIVRISLGGSRVRLVFSNAYGAQPVRIGGASLGLADAHGATEPGTIRKVTFGGKDDTLLPPGAPAVSDPLELDVEAQARLAVSIHLPEETALTTFHWDGRQTARLGDGNLTQAEDFTATATTDARVLLSEVLVDTPNQGAVVIVGDSITDGNGATVDADTRWPDYLAKLLAPLRVAVLNAGISGGRLLQDKMGVNVAARLQRDVFSQPGVRTLVLLIGINDIAWPGTAFAPDQQRPTLEEMIAGYRQVIALSRANNLRIVGATLPPFEGALSGTPLGNYYHSDKDALRQEVNRWIRESGAFDAIVDFDAILRDPRRPARLIPLFDSGDHLHPGDRGNEAMADAVDLDALLGR